MWTFLLNRWANALVKYGSLSITMPDGATSTYGCGNPHVAITLHDPSLPRRMVLTPELAVGEAYTDGTLTIENDDLAGLIELGMKNVVRKPKIWLQRPLKWIWHMARRLHQFNPVGRSRKNVAHHYDLSGELYELFLDADRQYSCAYFTDPALTLEEAQEAKKHHIARKLQIQPGMKVLDIGCGWGGMALTLARDYGAHVTGITLSKEQHAYATARAAKEGLTDMIRFELLDFRQVTGQFDRIVSVGMFEHVGVPHYRSFFRTIKRLLTKDGIALLHTIGRSNEPGTTSRWIAKYIFPGGYAPALSETAKAIEHEALIISDLEVWRLHYAETLRHWHERFMTNIDKARDMYDEQFCRMWRFYLLGCEKSFRFDQQVVFQFQLSQRNDTVPLTRSYLYGQSNHP